jgi:hypothetical protein
LALQATPQTTMQVTLHVILQATAQVALKATRQIAARTAVGVTPTAAFWIILDKALQTAVRIA